MLNMSMNIVNDFLKGKTSMERKNLTDAMNKRLRGVELNKYEKKIHEEFMQFAMEYEIDKDEAWSLFNVLRNIIKPKGDNK